MAKILTNHNETLHDFSMIGYLTALLLRGCRQVEINYLCGSPLQAHHHGPGISPLHMDIMQCSLTVSLSRLYSYFQTTHIQLSQTLIPPMTMLILFPVANINSTSTPSTMSLCCTLGAPHFPSYITPHFCLFYEAFCSQ